ncbi:MAG: hypothetical protein DLM50_05665 [Candidatus Meridianibacter frigidus]|nr:MAG: hypothetical protein DLM50_05665 [Candidatus Eremiobacteraeota bacterium]
MSRRVRSRTYARFKLFNALLFIVLGVFIIAQMAHAIGARFEAVSGYVLGAALVALGIFRLRGAVKARGE